MKETKFKNTEIGLIPEDWNVKSLGDICDKIGDGIHTTPVYGMGTCYFINGNNIKNGSIVITSATQTVDSNEAKKHHIQLTESTVLLSINGTIGNVALYNNENVILGKSAAYLIFKSNGCAKYAIYQLQNGCIINQFNDSLTGTTIKNLGLTAIRSTLFPLPPTIEEQSRIAQALSDIDSLIDSLDKLIQKKRNIKQGAMQELLTGKKRLKGFVKPWVKKKISDLGVLTGAGVDKKSYHNETPVRLVNYVDILHSDFLYNDQLDFWVTANNQKLIQCNVKKGDVFFTPSSEMPYDIAFSAVAMEDMENICYSYHIYRLRFNEDVDLKYRTYMFKTYDFYYQANQTCEGSGKRYVISLAKFRDMTVVYPQDKSEQTAIATILSDMDSEIESLEAKMEKYKAIKQGMMQELLSGRIRLI